MNENKIIGSIKQIENLLDKIHLRNPRIPNQNLKEKDHLRVYKILLNFRYSFDDLLPKKKEQFEDFWLSLMEIFEILMFYDRSKLPKRAIGYRAKGENNFDNILQICKTSIQLKQKNDLESILIAFGCMDAQLFSVESNAHNARRKINLIMKNIEDKIPKND